MEKAFIQKLLKYFEEIDNQIFKKSSQYIFSRVNAYAERVNISEASLRKETLKHTKNYLFHSKIRIRKLTAL